VVQYTYLNPGQYDVILTVANSFGGVIETRSSYITVLKGEPDEHTNFLPMVVK
jgi:PKD repeat protein